MARVLEAQDARHDVGGIGAGESSWQCFGLPTGSHAPSTDRRESTQTTLKRPRNGWFLSVFRPDFSTVRRSETPLPRLPKATDTSESRFYGLGFRGQTFVAPRKRGPPRHAGPFPLHIFTPPLGDGDTWLRCFQSQPKPVKRRGWDFSLYRNHANYVQLTGLRPTHVQPTSKGVDVRKSLVYHNVTTRFRLRPSKTLKIRG